MASCHHFQKGNLSMEVLGGGGGGGPWTDTISLPSITKTTGRMYTCNDRSWLHKTKTSFFLLWMLTVQCSLQEMRSVIMQKVWNEISAIFTKMDHATNKTPSKLGSKKQLMIISQQNFNLWGRKPHQKQTKHVRFFFPSQILDVHVYLYQEFSKNQESVPWVAV